MPITALPVLNRFSPTFKTDVDTFFGSQIPTFCTEANTLQTDVNAKQVTASAAAVDAAAQVTLATTQATNAALSATSAASSALTAGAIAWVSGTTYAIGNARFSPANGQTYRRLTAGAGTTDPSADATNWIVINGLTSEAIPLPANNLPNARPSLNLNFASSQTVDPRITFTRASTATRVNAKGLIEAVVSGVPRIDYDPVTGVCKGLLIEESRVNLLTYSEQFDNAAWVKTNATISPNAVASPDGTVTGDKLIDDVVNSGHYLQQLTTITTATAYTATVFIRAGERTKVDVLVYRGATFGGCSVDLSAGTKSTPQTAAVTDLSASAVVTALSSGFYRVSIPITSDGTSGGIRISLSNGSSTAYTGDGTSGLFVWGAQLEAGAFATSYIPTVASQVTRAADSASMTGTNFSSWYRQDEGSFVASFSINSLSTSLAQSVVAANDGTASNRATFRVSGASPNNAYVGFAGGVLQFALTSTVAVANTPQNISASYAANNFAYSDKGGAAVTDSAGSMPLMNQVQIGNEYSSAFLNGHIRSLTFYPKRLTNAELVALSTQ